MMAAIFAFSSIPQREMPMFGGWDTLVKKGGHAFGYALLTTAFWSGLEWKKRLFWLPFLMAVLYAATDELHQILVPGRHPSPIDVGIDAIGSSVAIGFWTLIRAGRAKAKPAQ